MCDSDTLSKCACVMVAGRPCHTFRSLSMHESYVYRASWTKKLFPILYFYAKLDDFLTFPWVFGKLKVLFSRLREELVQEWGRNKSTLNSLNTQRQSTKNHPTLHEISCYCAEKFCRPRLMNSLVSWSFMNRLFQNHFRICLPFQKYVYSMWK